MQTKLSSDAAPSDTRRVALPLLDSLVRDLRLQPLPLLEVMLDTRCTSLLYLQRVDLLNIRLAVEDAAALVKISHWPVAN